MAKTRSWSTTIPADGEEAAGLGGDIRNLRVDIEERMADIVTDWTADPVVLKPAGGIQYQLFSPEIVLNYNYDGGDSDYLQGTYKGLKMADNLHSGCLPLQVGQKIKAVSFLIHNNNSSARTITLQLNTRDWDSPHSITTIKELSSESVTGSTVQVKTLTPASSYPIESDDIIYVTLLPATNGDLYLLGIRVEFDLT